jgi:hypothetical protein
MEWAIKALTVKASLIVSWIALGSLRMTGRRRLARSVQHSLPGATGAGRVQLLAEGAPQLALLLQGGAVPASRDGQGCRSGTGHSRSGLVLPKGHSEGRRRWRATALCHAGGSGCTRALPPMLTPRPRDQTRLRKTLVGRGHSTLARPSRFPGS